MHLLAGRQLKACLMVKEFVEQTKEFVEQTKEFVEQTKEFVG
jgi:hypothetical protein